jgi:hypothetical protein
VAPVGVFLQMRPRSTSIRSVIGVAGTAGRHRDHGARAGGIGLRTARLQIARAARLAGFVVIDSRFGALDEALVPRGICASSTG